MDLNTLWSNFLDKIKPSLSSMSYETWFKDTKLISLDNGKATVEVPMLIHKNHLKNSYGDLIDDIFLELTSTNFIFEYYTEDELKELKFNNTIENESTSSNITYDTNLNSSYTFENFIVGESNKFAKATSLAVAEKPGFMYNPLFIYGNSGLGKTHLMHSIGNYIVKNTDKKVLYVTSEKFVSDFVGINKRNVEGDNFDSVDIFKKKYRDIDVLMIDDIQYLGSANQTQQEFFHTFNELHGSNKQIVISSDKSPEDLKLLENRLRTRFNWGLIIDILPPDFQLRMEIIDKNIDAKAKNINFPQDVKEYIASNCTSDIRKLEGAITRILAFATVMGGSPISLDLAIEALKDFFVKSIVSKNKIDQVQQLVASNYNITVEDLKSKKRVASISVPRQIAMYICRTVLEESLPKIGIEFGGKDHTTVMYAVDKIKEELLSNATLEVEIQKIVSQIK